MTARSRSKHKRITWATKPIEEYIHACTDSSPRVRRQAAAALELLGDRQAVEPLLRLLGDADDGVRGNAVRALGSLRDKRAVKPLLTMLHDRSPAVQSQAITALTRLNALSRVRDPGAMQALIHALNGSKMMRYEAARALGDMRQAAAVGPLVDALVLEVRGQPPDRHWGDNIAMALANIGEPAVLPLIELLTGDDTELRRLATMALRYTNDRRAIEPLKALLNHKDTMVPYYANFALQQLEDA